MFVVVVVVGKTVNILFNTKNNTNLICIWNDFTQHLIPHKINNSLQEGQMNIISTKTNLGYDLVIISQVYCY